MFPKFLNRTTLECVECSYKDGFVYDLFGTQTCVQCPADKPLILNYQCTACADNSFYDKLRRVCVRCEAGTKYLRESNSCEPICPAQSQRYNPATNMCECVQPHSFFNTATKQCVRCDLPQFWDYLSNACRPCADLNAHFNTTTQKCYTCPYRYRFDLATYGCVLD